MWFFGGLRETNSCCGVSAVTGQCSGGLTETLSSFCHPHTTRTNQEQLLLIKPAPSFHPQITSSDQTGDKNETNVTAMTESLCNIDVYFLSLPHVLPDITGLEWFKNFVQPITRGRRDVYVGNVGGDVGHELEKSKLGGIMERTISREPSYLLVQAPSMWGHRSFKNDPACWSGWTSTFSKHSGVNYWQIAI